MILLHGPHLLLGRPYYEPLLCFMIVYCTLFTGTVVSVAISPKVMDQTENETDTASFTCQATGEPVPTISWYFNDVPVDVTNTVKYAVTSAAPGQSVLRINNVQSSDVGTYTCNATNVVSSDTSSGVLTVNGED